MVTHDLLQLAERVWLFPHDPDQELVQPAIGVICGSHQTVLVDAGNSPTHSQRVLAALRELDAPPVAYVVYTHHHWDHIFGAVAYDAPVIAHDLCREHVQRSASRPWSKPFLIEQAQRQPTLAGLYQLMDQVVDDWSEFRVVVPTLTFSDRMSLHLDGLMVEVEHVGGQHADDSSIVRVPEAGVVFLGDCFYPPAVEDGGHEEDYDWPLLARLMDGTAHTYVHSHGKPFKRTGARGEGPGKRLS